MDPREAANTTRGKNLSEMVEAVDVLPTILASLNIPIPDHRIEGRNLLPLLHQGSTARGVIRCIPNWTTATVKRACW